MPAATHELARPWPRLLRNTPRKQPVTVEEELWMQDEQLASAWAVLTATGAAVALLLVLALLG